MYHINIEGYSRIPGLLPSLIKVGQTHKGCDVTIPTSLESQREAPRVPHPSLIWHQSLSCLQDYTTLISLCSMVLSLLTVALSELPTFVVLHGITEYSANRM